MSQVSFKVSTRVRKARLGRRLKPLKSILFISVILLVLISAFWLYSSNRLYNGSLALALILLMMQAWYAWDLAILPAKPLVSGDGILQLDQVVSAHLAADLVWPASAAELWKIATAHESGRFIINRLELDVASASDALASATIDAQSVWQEALRLQQSAGLAELDGGCLAAALLTTNPPLLAATSHKTLRPEDVLQMFLWYSRTALAAEAKKHRIKLGGIGRDWASGYTPVLNRYAHNISQEVEGSKVSYFSLARSQTLEQVITNLSRAERHNVIIVGPIGSGKTSLIYGLAESLLYLSQQKSTIAFQVMGLNPALITSASQVPGEIEQLMLTLFSDALHAGNMIIFLDEAQLFLQKGVGALDLSQLLLSVTQQSDLRLIMALSSADYQHLVSTNSALAGQFNVVQMPELSQGEVLALLQDRAVSLESQSGNRVTYPALAAIYRLAARHINTEAFPGKGIKLLEDSFSYATRGLVTASSVEQCLEKTTGIKAAPAGEQEKAQLLNLEDLLHQRMINQTQAVSAVANALRRNRAGVGNPKRPAGSFLFLGPTGVGKTELTKALAAVYFGGVDHIVRLDMSEYQQPTDVTRLLAPAAQGQSGTNLLRDVRQNPFSVVLLDELEKAHPDLLNLLLQMLDEGRLTDSAGQATDFTNCIIIATSNAGADDIRSHVAAGEQLDQFEKPLVDALISSHQFRAELINRFDEVVLFKPLAKPELRQIVALLLSEVNTTLANQNITVKLTEAATDYLVEQGYDPQFGARPLRRLIQQTVQNHVADGILRGQISPGAQVVLDQSDLVPAATEPSKQA